MQRFNLFNLLLLVITFCFVSSALSLKIGETCSPDNKCDDGLRCETCVPNGNTRPRCVRIKPLSPTSKVKNLPFNKYSWLTTHNSFSISGARSAAGSILVAPRNQEDNVTSQLNNGVRGIMLDLYDLNNDIWLCHSTGGKCYTFTAFQPAVDTLHEIQAFLEANPSEIVTIFIEDYVKIPQGLTKLFKASDLSKFLFPVSRMPKNGEDWPTVEDMVKQNQRLVVFTSESTKEASEGFAYDFRYVVQNKYGAEGMQNGSCPSRYEESPLNTNSRSLVLQNFFPSEANSTKSCADNSAPLASMLKTCFEAAGKRWPNFIAVDFYQRSDGGGVSEIIDEVNGHLTCGCDSISYCRADAPSGTCDVPQLAPPPPAAAEPPKEENVSANTGKRAVGEWSLQGILFITPLLLHL